MTHKRLALLAAAILMIGPASGLATTMCTSLSTLDQYVALGSAGCVIDNTIFSDFTYQSSASGFAVPLPSSGVSVAVDDTVNNPGLIFSGGWAAVGGRVGATNDSLIGFLVSVQPPSGTAIDDA